MVRAVRGSLASPAVPAVAQLAPGSRRPLSIRPELDPRPAGAKASGGF